NSERVERSLDFLEDSRDIEVASELLLICMVQYDDYLAPASQLVDDVFKLQEQIVEDGLNDKYLARAIPEESRRIYAAVLKAAWAKDDELNAHEKNILEVLRKELGLTRRHHRLLESKIGRFPQNGNKPFGLKQIEDAIKDLQLKGILLRFRTDDSYYVIPEELEKTVRYFRGGELKISAHKALLEHLTQGRLRAALEQHNRRVSGTKAELVERIQRFRLLPSQVLDTLTVADLNETMDGLVGIRKSGSKNEKIENIIDYFEASASPVTSDPTDDRAQYYDVFEEVASRDYDSLRRKDLITKDIEVERLFEAATRYLFEKKLEIPLLE